MGVATVAVHSAREKETYTSWGMVEREEQVSLTSNILLFLTVSSSVCLEDANSSVKLKISHSSVPMANTYTLNLWPFCKSLLEACYMNIKILVGTAQTAFYTAIKLEITNQTKNKYNYLYILEHESEQASEDSFVLRPVLPPEENA